MIKRSFLALMVLAQLCVAPSASAETSLDAAIDLWLGGDDAEALPMLAALAASGNSDARLLLGRIETTDLGPSPFRQSLEPAQSRALFRRNDNSNFGKSWLSIEAAEGNALAQALLRSRQPQPDPDQVKRLNDLGEHQATDYPTRIVALYGSQAMRDELRAYDGTMDDLQPYLAYLSDSPEPRGDGLAALRHIQPDPVSANSEQALGMAGFLALGLGYGDLSPGNPWRPAVENWLMTADATRPIAQLCNSHCAAEAPACSFAFLALLGGYFEVIRMDSPLETVIPQSQFLDSPRARLMVLRRAALARTETNLETLAESAPAQELSACAVDLVRQEQRKYN